MKENLFRCIFVANHASFYETKLVSGQKHVDEMFVNLFGKAIFPVFEISFRPLHSKSSFSAMLEKTQ